MATAKLYHTLTARILHWTNAACITLLIITGLYIGNPLGVPLITTMDTARKLHFIFMYFVIAGTIVRVYYSCINREYRGIFLRFRDFKTLPGVIKYYLFRSRVLPGTGRYNPGQKLFYNGLILLIIFQAVTGFMMYLPERLTRYSLLLGGPVLVRQTHYFITWIFISIIMVHLYLALLSGFSIIKSMFTGVRDNTPQASDAPSVFINK